MGYALIEELEAGTLAPPPPKQEQRPDVLPSEVARRWAVAMKLRSGNTRGPSASALIPVIGAWARENGHHPPEGLRAIGSGLDAAELRRRVQYRDQRRRYTASYLCLHKEDARLLWRLVRAAWAPGKAPGEQRRKANRPYPGHVPRPVHMHRRNREPLPLFHEALAAQPRNAKPVVDSLGRVWPSVAAAAAALGGNPKALNNAMGWLRAWALGPTVDDSPLRTALTRNIQWRGCWWRHLTPEEVKAVPLTYRTGDHLPALGWGLTCPKCGVHPTPWL